MKYRFALFLAVMAVLPAQGHAQGPSGAALERQRIAPDPTPGLNIRPVPGRQTVILRDYAGTNAGHPIPPVVVHIPSEFYRGRTTRAPVEVWGVNLYLQYPAMRPWPVENGCLGYCDGRLALSIQIGRSSQRAVYLGILRDGIARTAGQADPSAIYTRLEPPPDYDLAYEEDMVKWGPPRRVNRLYAKLDAAGAPVEFVKCAWVAPSPNCLFLTTLDGMPQLEVEYAISRDFWDQRDEVRAAVHRFVQSFLVEPASP